MAVAEINAALADPQIKGRLRTWAAHLLMMSPRVIPRWAKVIKFARIKLANELVGAGCAQPGEPTIGIPTRASGDSQPCIHRRPTMKFWT
jgi:hypothetical protein